MQEKRYGVFAKKFQIGCKNNPNPVTGKADGGFYILTIQVRTPTHVRSKI